MDVNKAEYSKSVFINCPFDEEYVPIFHAITFTLRFANFIPRSALETSDAGEERLSKISRAIQSCQYGIHDVSRVEFGATASTSLPRFNMPFECGLFFGALHFGSKQQKSKKLLILDSERYRFQKTLSDIAGKDPSAHNNNPAEAIACVRSFLADKPGAEGLPGEEFIQQKYAAFQKELPTILGDFKLNGKEIVKAAYWKDYVKIVDKYLTRRLPPTA